MTENRLLVTRGWRGDGDCLVGTEFLFQILETDSSDGYITP